jgi:hypothetical protein
LGLHASTRCQDDHFCGEWAGDGGRQQLAAAAQAKLMPGIALTDFLCTFSELELSYKYKSFWGVLEIVLKNLKISVFFEV